MSAVNLLASDTAANAGVFFMVFLVLFAISEIAAGVMFYKVLEKGHQPGWAAFVPIYNAMLLFKLSGKNPMLGLLFLTAIIPFIGGLCCFAVAIYLSVCVGKAFGKDTGFIVGMALLGIVFYPILGFGSSRYMLDAGAMPSQGFAPMPPG